MRKLFTICLLFVAFIGCEQKNENLIIPQPKLVQDFLNSSDYLKNECYFSNYGSLGIGRDLPLKVGGNQLIIPFYKGTMVHAYLEVIKVKKGTLPDSNQEYFMNLINLSKFDNNSLTGIVTMQAINYNNFEHTALNVINNKIKEVSCKDLPKEYQDRYSKGTLADFLDCYRHVKDYMLKSDDLANFVCDFIGSVCATSYSFTCIYMMNNDMEWSNLK